MTHACDFSRDDDGHEWLALILLALALTAAPARADSDLVILRTAPSAEFSNPAHRPALEMTFLPP